MPNNDKLLEKRKELSEEKLKTLQVGLEQLITNGQEITVKNIQSITGLSRSFLYQNKKAKALVEGAKRKSEVFIGPATSPTKLHEDKRVERIQSVELKRKLHESYVLQSEILGQENYRIKKELEDKSKYLEELKSLPNIKCHFVGRGFTEDDYVSFSIASEDGSTYNPVGTDRTIQGFTYGKYMISSKGYEFSLLNEKPETYLRQNGNEYMLFIGKDSGDTIEIEFLNEM